MSHGSRCLAALIFAGVLTASAVAPAQPLGPPEGTSLPTPAMAPAPTIPGYPPPPWGFPPPYAYPYGHGYRPVYPAPAARRPAGAEKRPMSTDKVVMIAGLAGFGAGWVASLLWGIGNEAAGVSCGPGYWGFPTCSGDDVDWSPVFIPVVGPFMQLDARGLIGAQKAVTAAFGGIQLAGLASFAIGLATHLGGGDEPSPAARLGVRLRLSPTVGPSGGTLGLTGTF